MKINNCSFYTQPVLNKNNKMPQKQNTSNAGFDYSLNEAIGRSQVNFTGKKPERGSDGFFIEEISQWMGMSDNDKIKFKSTVSEYLKQNKFSSVNELIEKQDAEELGAFIENIGSALNMSGKEFDDLSDSIVEFAMLELTVKQAKEDDVFAGMVFEICFNNLKDSEICEKLTGKLNIDSGEHVLKQLKRRRNEGIKPEQIAYELIEHYDLGYDDYKFIVKTINDVDKNFINDFLAENGQDEQL